MIIYFYALHIFVISTEVNKCFGATVALNTYYIRLINVQLLCVTADLLVNFIIDINA